MRFGVALLVSAAAACAGRPPDEPASSSAARIAPPVAPATAPSPVERAADPRCTGRAARGPIEVAVTVDDLPRHGKLPSGATRTQILETMLAAFAKHAVPQVYGMVNGDRAESDDERRALAAWIAAGHPLGNHAFSHKSAESMSPDAFLGLVDQNEPLLSGLAASAASFKVFRFPYLHQGKTLDDRAKNRAGLAARGYRVAEVTVDFADWAYTDPYVRCSSAHDERAIEAMRESYLDQAEAALAWSDAAACTLLGRPIRHVLILHCGAFSAAQTDALLAKLSEKGARFIGFDQAYEDRVYREEPSPPRSVRGQLLYQIARAREAKHVPIPAIADPVLGVLCGGPK